MLKYIISFLVIIVYIILPDDFGYHTSSGIVDHLLYAFNHTNLIHISLNIFSFILISIFLQKVYNDRMIYIYIIAYLISFLGSYITNIYDIPTNGLSGIINVMMGIYLVHLNRVYKTLYDVYSIILINVIYLLPMITLNALGLFNGSINVAIHIFCFLSGVVAVNMYNLFCKYKTNN